MTLVVIGVLFSAGSAGADMTFTINQNNGSPPIPPGTTAVETFSLSGNTLSLTIKNDTNTLSSQFNINQLFFNVTSTWGALTLTNGPSGAALTGSSTTQGLTADSHADGYGAFNWEVAFDSSNLLQPGQSFTMTFKVAGTGSESDLNTLSGIPPGSIRAYTAIKLINGPGDQSGYGATTSPGTPGTIVPEPGSVVLGLVGISGMSIAGLWRRFRPDRLCPA